MMPLPTCDPEHTLCARKTVGWKPASCMHCGLKKSVYQSQSSQVQDRTTRNTPTLAKSDDPDPERSGSTIPPVRPSNTTSSSTDSLRREQQSVAPRSRHPLRGHRRGLLIGASVVVAIFLIVSLASSFLRTPDVEFLVSNKEVDFEGRIDDRLLAIAPTEGRRVVIGSKDTDLIDGRFQIRGASPEATGLAFFEAGGALLGLDLVPKTSELADFETAISVESTAVALVLLHPQMSEFHTLGNPVGDAALKMIVSRTASFASLVDSLADEIKTDGISYLDAQSTTTGSLIPTVVNEVEGLIRSGLNDFRQIRSSGGGFGQSVGPKLLNRELARHNSQRGSESSIGLKSAYPLTCDYGLIPDSYGEADGLCVTLKSPKKEDWGTFAFDSDITIEITNLAPRAVAVFASPKGGEAGSLLGVVPPLEVSVGSTSDLVAWVFQELALRESPVRGPADYVLKKPESKSVKNQNSSDSAITMTFRNPTRLGVINTVSVLGTPDRVIDESLDERHFEDGRFISSVLTALSSYIFPSLSVLLDKGDVQLIGGSRWNVFESCPPSVLTDLIGGAALNFESAVADPRDGLSRIFTTESGASEIFWFIILRRFFPNERSASMTDTTPCEKTLAEPKIISACFPTLQSLWPFSIPPFSFCDSPSSRGLVSLISASIQRSMLSAATNPFAKLDLALSASSVALTGIFSFSDTARFGNADVYRLETVSTPLWCYEVSRSRSRFVGAFTTASGTSSLRSSILALRAGFEQLAKSSDAEFWSRESRVCNEISDLDPPSSTINSSQTSADAKEFASTFQIIAGILPSGSPFDRAKAIRELISGNEVSSQLNRLDEPVGRLDQVWKSRPQATRPTR